MGGLGGGHHGLGRSGLRCGLYAYGLDGPELTVTLLFLAARADVHLNVVPFNTLGWLDGCGKVRHSAQTVFSDRDLHTGFDNLVVVMANETMATSAAAELTKVASFEEIRTDSKRWNSSGGARSPEYSRSSQLDRLFVHITNLAIFRPSRSESQVRQGVAVFDDLLDQRRRMGRAPPKYRPIQLAQLPSRNKMRLAYAVLAHSTVDARRAPPIHKSTN